MNPRFRHDTCHPQTSHFNPLEFFHTLSATLSVTTTRPSPTYPIFLSTSPLFPSFSQHHHSSHLSLNTLFLLLVSFISSSSSDPSALTLRHWSSLLYDSIFIIFVYVTEESTFATASIPTSPFPRRFLSYMTCSEADRNNRDPLLNTTTRSLVSRKVVDEVLTISINNERPGA